jgi:hypothetical protein
MFKKKIEEILTVKLLKFDSKVPSAKNFKESQWFKIRESN